MEISDLSNNRSSPEVSTPPSLALKETRGHLKMREDVAVFNEKFGDYFGGVTAAFGLDEIQMRALISHESRFQQKAKNELGSKGYMQLTSAPIKDIAERPQLFAPFFEKLRLEDIPANAPKVLKDLCGIFQTGKVSYPKISALIPNLLAQKDEPYINLTIGLSYAAMLTKRLDTKGVPEKIHPFVDARLERLGKGEFLSMVTRRVQDVMPEIQVNDVKTSLEDIAGDFELKKDFLQHRDYNGNRTKYTNNIEHRDIYAATVSVIDRIARKNQSTSTRIQ